MVILSRARTQNIELDYVWKIKEEYGRFITAITTVPDAALDSDCCLGLC